MSEYFNENENMTKEQLEFLINTILDKVILLTEKIEDKDKLIEEIKKIKTDLRGE